MSFSLKRDEDSRCALAPIPLPSCANRRFCTPRWPETQARCANRRFCTPCWPKHSPRVQIDASAHGNGSVSLPSANQSIAELLYECEIVEILIYVLEVRLILV